MELISSHCFGIGKIIHKRTRDTDNFFQFLAFSYFYREPKRFEGGELFFPKYNYSFTCNNNSLIMMPAWVEHGVTKVSIKDSDYYDGYGRYAITSFFGNKQTE